MKKTGIIMIIIISLIQGIGAQVKNINISGSFQGVFTVSGIDKDYKVAGSPYLTESWMYGTLELKEAFLNETGGGGNSTASRTEENIEMIRKCNELIERVSDPEYRTVALKLTRTGTRHYNRRIHSDVELSESEFEELPVVANDLEEKLLAFLVEIRNQYESGFKEVNRIDGLFRYNLYAQEFEMIYGSDTLAIRSPLDIKSISLSNKKFIYGFYIEREFGNDYLGSSYFEVLNEGGCKLLVRHNVKIKSQSGPVTHSWAGGEGDSFVKIRQLYYQKAEGMEVKHMKKNRKCLKEIFADRYYEIEQYIRSERININDEKELIKVFNYYNSLDS